VLNILILILIYLLTAIGLTNGGSTTVHIYTQTIHRTTQSTILVVRLSGIRAHSGQNEEPHIVFSTYLQTHVVILR